MLPETFETHPSRYKHWRLSFDGPLARLAMDVQEKGGLGGTAYDLKLNSYDLGVDIELADAVQRIRLEHPEVRAVVLTSLKERIFCAGANIFMLGAASHNFKLNFCKFTNETRLAIEDASQNSGLKWLAAVNGTCAGGGYELALACDEILLVDDGTSAVSLPELPLLGVLPGTGGLTRVVDKRKVRRDLADAFATIAEGVRGSRAKDWGLVDRIAPRSRFDAAIAERAAALTALSDRPAGARGITLSPLDPAVTDHGISYRYVRVALDPAHHRAEITVLAPDTPQPATADEFAEQGADAWALRAFRELDDAILRLRVHHLDLGIWLLRTHGDPQAVLDADRALLGHRDHWLVREVLHHAKRVLKRLDLSARSIFALLEPGSCFAGSLAELALAADRSYMLNDPARPVRLAFNELNGGLLPMSNGISRLATRFLAEPERVETVLLQGSPFDAPTAFETGLVTFAPDEIDWDDEVRLALEERAGFSPDALTGAEANLRFAGPETMETKIFGRLSAWQNWVFSRPNATGEKGALKLYGRTGQRPELDPRRTG